MIGDQSRIVGMRGRCGSGLFLLREDAKRIMPMDLEISAGHVLMTTDMLLSMGVE